MSRTLYSGTKNASNWAFRAWLALREQNIDFEEQVVDIRRPQRFENLARVGEFSPPKAMQLTSSLRLIIMKNKYFILLLLLPLISNCSTPVIEDDNHQFLNVDGYKLEYKCLGAGSPTIFFEPPSGISAKQSFKNIYNKLAEKNRVCRYERLGFGTSDPVPEGLNQTVEDYATELRALVIKEAKEGDIVLIGYSFGGLIARYYTSKYPEHVKGILLIDAAHEKWVVDLKKFMQPDDWAKIETILDWFVKKLGHNYWDSQALVASSKLPTNLPIRIISRGLDYQRIKKVNLSTEGFRLYNDLHNKYQLEQEHLSLNTKRTVAIKSEHLILDSEPEVVMEAFNDLILTINNNQN